MEEVEVKSEDQEEETPYLKTEQAEMERDEAPPGWGEANITALNTPSHPPRSAGGSPAAQSPAAQSPAAQSPAAQSPAELSPGEPNEAAKVETPEEPELSADEEMVVNLLPDPLPAGNVLAGPEQSTGGTTSVPASPTVVMVFSPLTEPEFTVSDPIEFFGSDMFEGRLSIDGQKRSIKKNSKGTFPYRARQISDKKIMELLQRTPPEHEYFGYIFSVQSQRPPGYYHNYFLPIVRQPAPKNHIQLLGPDVPLDKIYSKRDSPKNMVPLSTIKVMWGSHRNRTVYKLQDIYAYLTRFGPIDAIYPISVNSCLVIFSDLEAARAAVQCQDLGSPWDRLIALWLEPRMHNYGFYCKYADVEKPPMRIRG